MERKTKNRIIGLLVIIGLIVLLLPFFHSKNEEAPDVALAKTPPFPDETVQVSATDSAVPVDATTPPAEQPVPDNSVSMQSDDVISVTHPSVVNSKTEIAANNKNQGVIEIGKPKGLEEPTSAATKTKSKVNKQTPNARKANHIDKPQRTTIPSVTAVQAQNTDNGLLGLKQAVYVIQLGSFKNKSNALRLVNQLRSNGYRAFLQHVSTEYGDNTRVYVGPENKRTAANALANRLSSDMHLQGIVISYKPLAL